MTTSISSNSTGIAISLSDDPFGNGALSTGSNTYGLVCLPISNVRSASIVVNASLYPWSYRDGLFSTFNSNLVWAAYYCSQTTKFTEMNSKLSLSYLNSKGQLASYPSFYTFGSTGETANNLHVMPIQGGGQVVIGENNNSFLKN